MLHITIMESPFSHYQSEILSNILEIKVTSLDQIDDAVKNRA